MTTIKERVISPSERWKESYSRSGVRLLEGAVEHAKVLGRFSLQLKDIALVLSQEKTIRETLSKLNLDSSKIHLSLESKLNRPIAEDLWTGSTHNISIEDMIKVAQKEKEDGGASKIRAGDILMAILQSSTPTGKALKETLFPGKEKDVSFLSQLRNVVDQVEKPWVA